MINPNKLGRSPFPRWQAQWMMAGRISSGPVAPIDPSTIAGLKPWLKADAGTSLLRDALGEEVIMPASVDGDPVALWQDQSGNGYHLGVNLGAGETPIYKTNILNGKPVLRFDGVNDHMFPPGSSGISQPNTVFMVLKQNSASPLVYEFSGTGGQNINLNTSGFLTLNAGADVSGSTNLVGAFHVFSAVFSGGVGTGYADGVLQLSGAVGGGSVGVLNIGSYNSPSNFAACDIAEILIYNSALSTTDRQNVEYYLKTKYGL